MMETIDLEVMERSERGKGAARKTRASGRVPAVLYGGGEPSVSLSLDAKALSNAISGSPRSLLRLTRPGGESLAIVKELDRHVLSGDILHVDFQRISMESKLTLSVPVRLVGECPGVKSGGIIEHSLREIEIRCLPAEIPDCLEVDVSGLEMGESIHVDGIIAREGIEILEDGETLVVTIAAPVKEEEKPAEAAEGEAEGEGAPEEEGKEGEEKKETPGEAAKTE